MWQDDVLFKIENMDIYKAIIDDHNIQRSLCKKLKETKEKGKKARNKAYKELKVELKAHEVAEERFFYEPLIDTDEMIEDARHGMAEHHEMDEVMNKMDDTEVDSDTWFKLAEDLCHKVDHHLKDEEEEFFKKAKGLYSEKEADKLAKKYEKEMKEYRTEYTEEEEEEEEE